MLATIGYDRPIIYMRRSMVMMNTMISIGYDGDIHMIGIIYVKL